MPTHVQREGGGVLTQRCMRIRSGWRGRGGDGAGHTSTEGEAFANTALNATFTLAQRSTHGWKGARSAAAATLCSTAWCCCIRTSPLSDTAAAHHHPLRCGPLLQPRFVFLWYSVVRDTLLVSLTVSLEGRILGLEQQGGTSSAGARRCRFGMCAGSLKRMRAIGFDSLSWPRDSNLSSTSTIGLRSDGVRRCSASRSTAVPLHIVSGAGDLSHRRYRHGLRRTAGMGS